MENKNVSGIYEILNTENNKRYIGSSRNILLRFRNHKNNLKKNKHRNIHLQASYNLYGKDSFIFNILEKTENLYEREKYYMDKYNWDDLYNMATIPGAGGGNLTNKEIFLLDLEGNIIKKYNSGLDLAKEWVKKDFDYSSIDSKKVYRKNGGKYRVAHPEFYYQNIDLIKSWPTVTNPKLLEIQEKSEKYYEIKYKIFINNKEYLSNTISDLSSFTNLSKECISQYIRKMKKENINTYISLKYKIVLLEDKYKNGKVFYAKDIISKIKKITYEFKKIKNKYKRDKIKPIDLRIAKIKCKIYYNNKDYFFNSKLEAKYFINSLIEIIKQEINPIKQKMLLGSINKSKIIEI